MIEVEVYFNGERRAFLIQLSTVARCTRSGEFTQMTLTDGTEFTVAATYERVKYAISTARSQFVSLIEAAA